MVKVLLMEDAPENADMLSRRLRRRGYEVVLVANGRQSVELAKTMHPDLILMDMRLPVMDGLEATRMFRGIAAIATSQSALAGHAMSGIQENALTAGCNDYHTKPVEMTRLLEHMDALMPPHINRSRPQVHAFLDPYLQVAVNGCSLSIANLCACCHNL